MSSYYEDMPPKHSAPPRSPAKMMMQYSIQWDSVTGFFSSSWLGPFLNGYREQKIQRHGHFDGFNMDLIVLKTGLMVIVDCWVLINGSRIAYLNDQDLSLLTRLLSPLVPPVDRWASNGQLFMFYMNQGLNSLYQKREDWLLCYKATKNSLKYRRHGFYTPSFVRNLEPKGKTSKAIWMANWYPPPQCTHLFVQYGTFIPFILHKILLIRWIPIPGFEKKQSISKNTHI